MKHFTLLSLFLSCAACLNAAETPSFAWAKVLDGPLANVQNGGIAVTTDGNFVSYNSFQSSGSDSPCYFGDDLIANGSAISSDRNLMILKTDAQGNKLWSVHSTNGYFDSADGKITPTADGGVLVLTKTRPSQNGTEYIASVLVDAAGDRTELYDMNTSIWAYCQALIKIDANGHIEWAKVFLNDQLPVPAATATAAKVATTNGVNPYSLCTDTDGNIYIAGNYRSPMVLSGKDNGCFVLCPRDVAAYNGDPQQTGGSLYIIKLDAEGNYLNHVKATGENNYEKINGVHFLDGNIVFNGNIKGNGKGSSLTIGEATFSIDDDNTFDNVFVGSVKASDLSANYLRLYSTFTNSAKKFVVQVKNSIVADGKMYICGALNGGIGDSDAASALIATDGTMLEAFALQVNLNDGSIGRAFIQPGTAITGYYGCFLYNGNVYFQGYTIAKNAFLDHFPADGEWTDNARFTFLDGNVGMANAATVNDNTAVLVSRVNAANGITVTGTETKPKTTGYGLLFTSYNLGGTVAVPGISQDGVSGTVFTGDEGHITVSTASPAKVDVYTPSGAHVASADAPAGTSHITLPAGVYIANGNKVIVR